VIPFDTDPRAHQVHVEALRRLGPSARAEQALEMSELARETSKAGIKKRHPSYTAEDTVRALVWLLYGEELARKIWKEGARAP